MTDICMHSPNRLSFDIFTTIVYQMEAPEGIFNTSYAWRVIMYAIVTDIKSNKAYE